MVQEDPSNHVASPPGLLTRNLALLTTNDDTSVTTDMVFTRSSGLLEMRRPEVDFPGVWYKSVNFGSSLCGHFCCRHRLNKSHLLPLAPIKSISCPSQDAAGTLGCRLRDAEATLPPSLPPHPSSPTPPHTPARRPHQELFSSSSSDVFATPQQHCPATPDLFLTPPSSPMGVVDWGGGPAGDSGVGGGGAGGGGAGGGGGAEEMGEIRNLRGGLPTYVAIMGGDWNQGMRRISDENIGTFCRRKQQVNPIREGAHSPNSLS